MRPLAVWTLPSLAWGAALLEILLSLRKAWFVNEAFFVHDALLTAASRAAFAGAALVFVPPIRAALRRHAQALAGLPPRAQAAWLAALTGALALETGFIRVCQHRGFQLPQDTAVTANIAYNVLHHGRFESSVLGLPSYFAVHFMPVIALFAPLLLLAKSALVLLLAQQAVTATVPAALFLLCRRAGGSPGAALVVALTAWASPFFQFLCSSSLALQVAVPAFFLWGMLAFESGRPRLGAAALALMLLCIEQAPLALFGLGLYRARQRRAEGTALCLGAAALFAAEVAFIASHPGTREYRDWSMFRALGPGPGAMLAAAAAHPFEFAGKVLWPPARLAPAFSLFTTTAFLGLFDPARLLPWAVTFLPNLLADSGSFYHTLILHYSAYVIGPLWWAAAGGAARAEALLTGRGLRPVLACAGLVAAGLSLRGATRAVVPGRAGPAFADGPAMLARIPEDAPAWATEYLSSAVAARAHLKSLSWGGGPEFERGLFVPDYILLDKGWVFSADKGLRSRVAGFLKKEGYGVAADAPSMVLFRHPRAPLAPGDRRPPDAVLPPPREGVDFRLELDAAR